MQKISQDYSFIMHPQVEFEIIEAVRFSKEY